MVTPIQSSSNEALDMRVRKYSFIFIYKAVSLAHTTSQILSFKATIFDSNRVVSCIP